MIIFGVLFVCVFSIITVANLKLQLVTNAADAILATVAFIYGQQLCHLLLLNLNTMLLALACWTLLRLILLAQTVDTLSFQELQEIGKCLIIICLNTSAGFVLQLAFMRDANSPTLSPLFQPLPE